MKTLSEQIDDELRVLCFHMLKAGRHETLRKVLADTETTFSGYREYTALLDAAEKHPDPNWEPTPEDVSIYLQFKGQHCPNCEHTTFTGEEVEIDEGAAYQWLTCEKCGSKWQDVYSLVGIHTAEHGTVIPEMGK